MYPSNVQSAFGDDSLTVDFNEGDIILGVKINAWNVIEYGGGVDQIDARITDGGVEPGIASLPLYDVDNIAYTAPNVATNVYHPMHISVHDDTILYFDRSGGYGNPVQTEVYWVASTTPEVVHT